MDSLPPPFRVLAGLGLGLFLTWKVVTSLKRGEVSYKRSHHKRSEEPKTFWFTIAWFSFLGVMGFAFAVMELILIQRTTP